LQAKTVVAELDHKLTRAAAVGGGTRLVLEYIENVKSALYMYTRDGVREHKFPLDVGQVVAIRTLKDSDEASYHALLSTADYVDVLRTHHIHHTSIDLSC